MAYNIVPDEHCKYKLHNYVHKNFTLEEFVSMGSKSLKNPTGKTKLADNDVPNENPQKASNASLDAPTTGAEPTPVPSPEDPLENSPNIDDIADVPATVKPTTPAPKKSAEENDSVDEVPTNVWATTPAQPKPAKENKNHSEHTTTNEQVVHAKEDSEGAVCSSSLCIAKNQASTVET